MAEMALMKARKLATTTTAVVVPDRVTMLPMHMERMNWAMKTMLETTATSVPSPRIWPPVSALPSAESPN